MKCNNVIVRYLLEGDSLKDNTGALQKTLRYTGFSNFSNFHKGFGLHRKRIEMLSFCTMRTYQTTLQYTWRTTSIQNLICCSNHLTTSKVQTRCVKRSKKTKHVFWNFVTAYLENLHIKYSSGQLFKLSASHKFPSCHPSWDVGVCNQWDVWPYELHRNL